jgi:RNase P protein component
MAIHSAQSVEAPAPAGPSGSVPGAGSGVRMTVVASRRVGNAVERNRAKRLLREAARLQAWRDGIDVVLVARSACTSSGLAAVSDELRSLGTRLGVLDRIVDQDRDQGDVHEGAPVGRA